MSDKSKRKTNIEHVFTMLHDTAPGRLVPGYSRPTASPKMHLKGLLGVLPPPSKEIPIPSYAFPKLKQLVDDLQSQLLDDRTKSLLWMGSDQYMFLKNLLVQIEQKVSNKKVPKTASYGVSIDILLLLVGKLQNYTSKQQQTKLKQLLMVMDKFVAIEKCLIGKIEAESKQALRDKLVYDLDVLFEAFLIDVISSDDDWTPVSIQNKLRRRLTAVSEQDLHPIIATCTEEGQGVIGVIDITTRTSSSLYVKVRNELLLLCNEFGVQLPTPLTVTLEFVRGASKIFCEHAASIENIISVFAMMGYSKKNAHLISGLVKFYCDIMHKDAKMSSVTRFLLVLAQYKKAADKAKKEEKANHTLVSETVQFAEKAGKVVNKKPETSHLDEMYRSLGMPRYEESNLQHAPASSALASKPQIASPKAAKKQETASKGEENKIPTPRGPRANPYALYGKHSHVLGRTTNIMDSELITSVKESIANFELDPATAGFLLTGFYALRRSFQIEGWNALVRSFNYHVRSKLGEKMRGREPKPPMTLLSYGRWNKEEIKEKQVYLALNRSTLVSNIMLMGATFYSFVTVKIFNAMGEGTSAKLLEEDMEEGEESDSDDDLAH